MENVVLNGCSVHATFFPFLWAPLHNLLSQSHFTFRPGCQEGTRECGLSEEKEKSQSLHHFSLFFLAACWGGHMRYVRVRSPWGEMEK